MDPKFYWRATRDCPYVRPVTHMCWCEQISPLAHSSQATWQPFNLSHCIEMHNTHLLGRAGQLSQAYFTHSAPILTPRNLPPTVNKYWLPLREFRMSRHTRFNTSRKMATAAMNCIFLGTNAVYRSIGPSVRIRFYISIVSKMSKSLLFEMRFANLSPRSSSNFGETWPGPAAHAWRHFCFLSSRDVVWLISTQNPSCVALHNAWFDSFVA